ncbi:MAG: hypothetical protein GXP31_10005 [Kiritimatiellaeota bacterium]|nr:hypothetical protein [Kiritimatiellota bacterium]
MSLLGIDAGTTGCKAVVFRDDGTVTASGYVEYDVTRPETGWEELDSELVWQRIRDQLRHVVHAANESRPLDPIRCVAVSSLGEAVVPVSRDRRILGPSLLNSDARGAEYLESLAGLIPDETLYAINGNVLGNHYSLTKLMWLRDHRPELWRQTFKFLHWGPFISFMLGADPAVDYSLANRTLLFDLNARSWSSDLLECSRIDGDKLPRTVPSGTPIGTVSAETAGDLGLPRDALIVSGAHDQCANAVGCGVTRAGTAMYGMGTFICIVPVFAERRPATSMMPIGLNTEHHAVPGRFVSFIYNQGGSLVKWYRNTFAGAEHRAAVESGGEDIYPALFGELPLHPSPVLVLPHFTATGPPHFITSSCGVMAGLHLDTTRGDVLKGILEGTAYYLRECVERLPEAGLDIGEFRAVGGGSRSDAWVQLSADILGRPFSRPRVTEAGALGAAILAGVGAGVFVSAEEGASHMVTVEHSFEPDPQRGAEYSRRYALYRELWPRLRDFLPRLS